MWWTLKSRRKRAELRDVFESVDGVITKRPTPHCGVWNWKNDRLLRDHGPPGASLNWLPGPWHFRTLYNIRLIVPRRSSRGPSGLGNAGNWCRSTKAAMAMELGVCVSIVLKKLGHCLHVANNPLLAVARANDGAWRCKPADVKSISCLCGRHAPPPTGSPVISRAGRAHRRG